MKLRFGALGLTVACLSFWALPVHGAGKYLQVEYPASTAANELQIGVNYTMWIPDDVSRFRCVIVHQHGAGRPAAAAGATASYDLHWQALAKKWDCALLGPSYHVLTEATDATPGGSELWFDPRRGSDKTFQKALAELAAQAKHPELATVPWALWGHSGGGIWSDMMTVLHPDRVAAVFLRSGSFRNRPNFPPAETPAAAYTVPIMGNAGIKEKERGAWINTLFTAREYRSKGGPAAFAPDPRTGHETGDARYLAIPFFDATLAMRLPNKGSKDQTLRPIEMSRAWLAPFLGETAQPASEYKGNASEAAWLPNAAVAKAWMEYVKTGATTDTTAPPAPFDVRVSKEGQGIQVSWNAEADFESGIGGFILLRDGKELTKLPQTNTGKYGRALFQQMSFHDTPEKPMPEMRYLDTSPEPGKKHTYAVVAVNSAGLSSRPSDAKSAR